VARRRHRLGVPRAAITYPVRFGGWVEHTGRGTDARARWRPSAEVAAKAYDMVIPGHGTDKVSTLRLWKAAAPAHIDLNAFNTGDYARAASAKNESQKLFARISFSSSSFSCVSILSCRLSHKNDSLSGVGKRAPLDCVDWER